MSPRLRPNLFVAVLLLVVGVVLLMLAEATPWHTDAGAYSAELNRLQAAQETAPDEAALTRAFHANVERYATRKWLYADLGCSLMAWSALIAVVAVLYRRTGLDGLLRTQRRPLLLAVTVFIACGLAWTGLVAEAIQSFRRGLLPSWGDSLSIPIYGACVLTLCLAPVLLLLVVTPCLLRRRSGDPILLLRGVRTWSSILVGLIYAPFALLGIALISLMPQTGGWAYSPAGALIFWLMLNARALATGRRQPV